MSQAVLSFDESAVMHGVSWDAYVCSRAASENDGLRLTYSDGMMEIMSPSHGHERVSHLLGRFVDEWTIACGIDVCNGRSTTFQRADLGRGLEPDNCYWIESESRIRTRDQIDLTIDPPPDLAIEVEVTKRVVPRLPIYQALQVGELWRWRNEGMEVLILDPRTGYVVVSQSRALPGFPIEAVCELIAKRHQLPDTALIRTFRTLIETSGTR